MTMHARHREMLCALVLAAGLLACAEPAPVSMQGVNVKMALGPSREMQGDRTGDGVRLTVQPSVRDGERRLLTFTGYQASDVHHLGIALKQGGSVLGTQTVNRLADGSWLPVLFDNLHASSTYEVSAIAYQSANDALPISNEVVQTVNTGTNAFVAADITIPLLDRPVSATVSTNVQVTTGQWLDPGTAALGALSGVVVSTVAGNGYPGAHVDGKVGTQAMMSEPTGVRRFGENLYVAARGHHRILKFDSGFTVSSLAGSETWGYADGTGTAASFNTPEGLAIDGAGNLYVADTFNHGIRKVTLLGEVTTLAGTGAQGYVDGSGTSAQFNYPSDVAVDVAGNLYVADTNNHRIRKVTTTGLVTTLAGSGTPGYADGTGATAQFDTPSGIAVDASGNLVVADRLSHRIRRVTPLGVVTTLAGSSDGYQDATTGVDAKFSQPYGVCLDGAGNIYIAERAGHRVRRLSPQGGVTTIAGSGVAGYQDAMGASARFKDLTCITVGAETATQVTLYVTEWGHRLRQIVVPKQ